MPNRVRNSKTVAAAPKAKAAEKAAETKPAVIAPETKKPDARLKDEVNLTRFVSKAIKTAGPGPYELVPGRNPGTVSLPQILEAMGASPQGQQAVAALLENLRQKTGIVVGPEVQAALMSNPSGATTALELTPRQLSRGVMGLNAAYQAGQVPPVAPREHLLESGFDFANLATLNAPRNEPKLKQIAPGLFMGSLPSTLSDEKLKSNKVLAETLDRLARNASAAPGTEFSVKYRGVTISKLDDFLAALKANGHEVKVTFEQRVANFADLKAPVPNTNPQQFAEVAAPLMVRTGIRDAAGKEAVVPAAHSEMIISISSGPDSKDPKIDAEVRYFQGIDGTGFFAKTTTTDVGWLGRVTHAELGGDEAIKAVSLAGALGDVIGAAAKDANLYAEGYGATGVCNDSVAVVQMAMMGRADQYPLLMRDELLFAELKKRLNDADLSDDPIYQALRKAIDALPSDTQLNASLKARALTSLPFAEGQEPFTSTVDARRILSTP